MKKTFRTLTSGFGNTDDVIRLRLDITSSKGVIKKGVEVKAIVDDQLEKLDYLWIQTCLGSNN